MRRGRFLTIACVPLLVGSATAGALAVRPTAPALPVSVPLGPGLPGDAQIVVDPAHHTALAINTAVGAATLDGVTSGTGSQASWISLPPQGARTPASIINTDTGALIRQIDVGAMSHVLVAFRQGGSAVSVDAAAGRLSLIDLIHVGVAMAPYPATSFNPVVFGAAIDGRTDHLLATTMVDTRSPHVLQEQAVALFDARTGALLRLVRLPGVEPVWVTTFVGNPGASMVPVAVSAAPRPWSLLIDDVRARAFILSTNRTIMILDRRDGHVLRTRRLPLVLHQAVLDSSSGHLFALADAADANSATSHLLRGNLAMIDERTGSILRTVRAGFQPQAIAIDTIVGHVFVADYRTGTVSVFRDADGTLLRRIGVPGAVDVAVDGRHAHLYVSAFSGRRQRILVLDSRTGLLLHTVVVNANLSGMVPDSGTGHLLLLASSPGPIATRVVDRWGWVPGWLRSRVGWLPPAPPVPSGMPAPSGPPAQTNEVITLDPLHTAAVP